MIADALFIAADDTLARLILDAEIAVDRAGDRAEVERGAALAAWLPLPDYVDGRAA